MMAMIRPMAQLAISDKGGPIESVDKIEMPTQDNDLLREKALESQDEVGPKVFAEPLDINLVAHEEGSWESLEGGLMLWRQRIYSPKAYSLNLAFTDFFLPPSAHLYLYDVNKTHVIGPIRQEDNDVHGQWWSPIIPFDEVVIELQIMPEDLPKLRMTLTKVNHDFSGFGAVLSGSCNLDVACGTEQGFDLVDKYRDQINSVGMYQLNGFEQCSGVLINNVRNDCTPYFLTAHHCEITPSNSASVVVYWNYQNSTCRLPGSSASGSRGDGSLSRFNSGSSLVATYGVSDFSLLLLDDPVDPDIGAYFAGWDWVNEEYDSAFCVHHPNTEEKRISIDYDSITPFADEFYFRVEDWDIGTTEGGSSGSPLFSKEGRIIGQLFGGQASCGNDLFDDYGMMNLSWEGGGTPQTRLRDWLDPDDTGVTSIDGRSCSDVLGVNGISMICALETTMDTLSVYINSGLENGVSLMTRNVPVNLKVSLEKDSIGLGDSSLVFIEMLPGLDVLRSDFEVVGTSEEGQVSIGLTVLAEFDLPDPPRLISPLDGAVDISLDVVLEWDGQSDEYLIEVSEDDGFVNIIQSIQVLNEERFNLFGLSGNTRYYWRATESNFCGRRTSEKYSFWTGSITCQSIMATDGLPILIGDNDPVTIESSLTVTAQGTISDVNIIGLRGRHTYIQDLVFRLRSPSGTTVNLIVNPCESENDFDLSLDDESEIINLDCPPNRQSTYRPLNPLSTFDGEQAAGTWTLIIEDEAALDGGSLDAWSLELCTVKNYFGESRVRLCLGNLSPVTLEGTISGDLQDPLEVRAFLADGTELPIDTDPIEVKKNEAFTLTIDQIDLLVDQEEFLVVISDSIQSDTSWIAVQTEPQPDKAFLQDPSDNSIDVSRKPEFRWASTSVGVQSQLRVYDDEGLMNVVIDTIIDGFEFIPNSNLAELTKYYWIVQTIDSCSSNISDVFSFTTELSTSTKETAMSAFSVYPNPTQNVIYIDREAEASSASYSIQIIDVLGQNVLTLRNQNEATKIDISHLESGFYFVRIVQGNKRRIVKIMVQDP